VQKGTLPPAPLLDEQTRPLLTLHKGEGSSRPWRRSRPPGCHSFSDVRSLRGSVNDTVPLHSFCCVVLWTYPSPEGTDRSAPNNQDGGAPSLTRPCALFVLAVPHVLIPRAGSPLTHSGLRPPGLWRSGARSLVVLVSHRDDARPNIRWKVPFHLSATSFTLARGRSMFGRAYSWLHTPAVRPGRSASHPDERPVFAPNHPGRSERAD
jgi:hypothetical protein